jgi:hypothetical protein
MNQLSKNLSCIYIRNGIEIWIEDDRAETLRNVLKSPNAPQFIEYENRIINRADLVGIYSALDMENMTRRKNGEWLCKSNTWHGRGEKCECLSLQDRKIIENREQAIKNCGKCQNGYIHHKTKNDVSTVVVCECVRDLN